MRYLRFAVVPILALLVMVGCSSDNDSPKDDQNDTFDRAAMLANCADNIIIPAYTAFNFKVVDLKSKTTDFNQNPTVENLQTLRAAWEDAYVSFQHVSMFEIGKAEELRFRNRLNVYPTDVLEVESFIESGVYDFSLPSTIDDQGFPALDYLINGLAETDLEIIEFYISNSNAAGYKTYLQTLSNTMADLTNQVLSSWTNGYRHTFVANTSSSASGSVDNFTQAYIFYYEKALRAGKVGIPAGIFSNQPLPENVEAYYKKDISKKLLLEAIDATRNFFDGKHFGNNSTGPSFKTYLDYLNTIKNGENLSALIDNQFTVAKNKANELNANFVLQIETDNSKMLGSYNELQRIVVLLKVDMVQALNIAITYVDADGD